MKTYNITPVPAPRQTGRGAEAPDRETQTAPDDEGSPGDQVEAAMICFSVQCEPKPQGRHRTATRGRDGRPLPFARTYTDAQSENMRAVLVGAAQEVRPDRPLEGPLVLLVTVRKMKPKSYSRKRWAWDSKPDLDNFVKLIDCFNGILWRDDSQIIEIHARKEFADAPGFDFQIEEATA